MDATRLKQLAWQSVIIVVSVVGAVGLGYLLVRFPLEYTLAAIFGLGILFGLIRSPWFGFLALAFALPFERIGSVDIGGMTLRPSQVIIACLLLYVFLGIAKRDPRIVRFHYPIAIPLVLYAIVAGFSLLNAPNLSRSVSVLIFVLFTMSVSAVVPLFLNTEKKLQLATRVLLASMAVVTVFGIYQWVGDFIGLPPALTGLRELYTKDVLGFPRVQSTALEPLYFANYLLLPLCLLTALFIRGSKLIPVWLQLGLLALGFANLALTVARGGYIAMAGSLTVLIVWYFVNQRLFSWRVVLSVLGVLCIGVIAATQLEQFEGMTEKIQSHVLNIFGGASFNERALTFEQATAAFQTHPWIGIGPGSFGPTVSPHPMIQPETGWAIVNNVYLETLAETGVFGALALFSAVLIVILRSIYALTYGKNTQIQTLLIATLAAFIGILIQYNTFSVLYIIHIWFVIGFLIALQNIALAQDAKTS
jgi:O-antigen ligase